MTRDAELALFRILQEALANVLHHSHANRAIVLITLPLTGAVSGVVTAIAVLLGVGLLVTAAAGYCPLYAWAGIGRRRARPAQ